MAHYTCEFNIKQYDRRTGEVFPSAILTLVSIIQGVALSVLIEKTFAVASRGVPLATLLPYICLCFGNLVIVAYEYLWFVGLFTGDVSIFDILTIFALGFTEVAAISHLADPANWWFFNWAFCFSGGFALTNSLGKARYIRYEPEQVRGLLVAALRRNLNLCGVAALLSAGAMISTRDNRYEGFVIFICQVLIGVLMVYLVAKDRRFLLELRAICEAEKERERSEGG